MKYGIVTCGLEPNYGACLQAFATQKVLDSIGIENELINYSFLEEHSYSPLKQPNMKAAISCMLFYRLRKRNHYAFQSFRDKYMRYSKEKVTSVMDLKKRLDYYEGFIIGSDQVWNPFLGIDINVTLLNFYKAVDGPKKISYASSFGVEEIPHILEEKYRDCFNDFDNISVREDAGRLIVSKLTGKDVPVVMDPCALLSIVEWSLIENQELTPSYPYVLVYDMRHDSALFDYSINLSRQLGCKVVALSRIVVPRKDITTLYGVSPAHFISLIKNATYIITDSFHGTLFSILFKKNFITFCNNRGAAIGSRIKTILTRLNLNDRLLVEDSMDNSSFVSSPQTIDYFRIDGLIEDWRKESLTYLKNCFK